MGVWQDQRNAAAQRRLEGALPPHFPKVVVTHALVQRWVPDLPRRAIESYWHGHPVRADRLCRALARRSGAPAGWVWEPRVAGGFRIPPTPFRDNGFGLNPGHCCICGQPVYRFGWHEDLWQAGRINTRARWHAACVSAWKLWIAPVGQLRLLGRMQARRCAITKTRLLRDAEVDHRVPLFRVWRDERTRPWPDLLAFWGFPNLQAVNAPAHREKTVQEASGRAAHRRFTRANDAVLS